MFKNKYTEHVGHKNQEKNYGKPTQDDLNKKIDQGLANQGLSRVDGLKQKFEALNLIQAAEKPNVQTQKPAANPLMFQKPLNTVQAPKPTVMAVLETEEKEKTHDAKQPTVKELIAKLNIPMQQPAANATASATASADIKKYTKAAEENVFDIDGDDFLNGDWLFQLEQDYQDFLKTNNKVNTWEHTFSLLFDLWTDPNTFFNQVENLWKEGKYDNYIQLEDSYLDGMKIVFHVENDCPAYANFRGPIEDKGPINFSDPNKGYFKCLKATIKSMHFDLYRAYRSAQKTGDKIVMAGIFKSVQGICMEARISALQTYMLKCLNGALFEDIVENILNDYAEFKCLVNFWPKMHFNLLAVQDDGIHFYLEDILDFAKHNYADIRGNNGETINDLEKYLEAMAICDRKPTAPRAMVTPKQVNDANMVGVKPNNANGAQNREARIHELIQRKFPTISEQLELDELLEEEENDKVLKQPDLFNMQPLKLDEMFAQQLRNQHQEDLRLQQKLEADRIREQQRQADLNRRLEEDRLRGANTHQEFVNATINAIKYSKDYGHIDHLATMVRSYMDYSLKQNRPRSQIIDEIKQNVHSYLVGSYIEAHQRCLTNVPMDPDTVGSYVRSMLGTDHSLYAPLHKNLANLIVDNALANKVMIPLFFEAQKLTNPHAHQYKI